MSIKNYTNITGLRKKTTFLCVNGILIKQTVLFTRLL
jgi:hypothetical protein